MNCRMAPPTQFLALTEMKYVVGRQRMDYNYCRSHSSLGYMAPAAFAVMVAKNLSGLPPGKLPSSNTAEPQVALNSHKEWAVNWLQVKFFHRKLEYRAK